MRETVPDNSVPQSVVRLDGRAARRARGLPRLEALYADYHANEARITELTELANGSATIGHPERFMEYRQRIEVYERRRVELERDIAAVEVAS